MRTSVIRIEEGNDSSGVSTLLPSGLEASIVSTCSDEGVGDWAWSRVAMGAYTGPFFLFGCAGVIAGLFVGVVGQ